MADYFSEIIQVLILAIGAYIIYYARQKGENQADKSDLKKITDIVEQVKIEYASELEKLRANLSIITSKKNLVFQE